jgi:hypothetical protein
MGGPYIGRLEVNGAFVCENVLVDNYIINKENIYFVVYKEAKWAKDISFSVYYYNSFERILFEIKHEFHRLFIKEFIDEKHIKIFKAFHDELSQYESVLDVSKYNHIKIELPNVLDIE